MMTNAKSETNRQDGNKRDDGTGIGSYPKVSSKRSNRKTKGSGIEAVAVVGQTPRTYLSPKSGWCSGAEHEQDHAGCFVEYVTTHHTANTNPGDIVRCRCNCHGK